MAEVFGKAAGLSLMQMVLHLNGLLQVLYHVKQTSGTNDDLCFVCQLIGVMHVDKGRHYHSSE